MNHQGADHLNSEVESAGTADPLEHHYQRLELALVMAATSALTGSSLPDGAPVVSAETAVKLLTLRGASAARSSAGGRLPQVDPAQLRRTLAARIMAVRHVTAHPSTPNDDPE